jgi:glycosyltransferase involved in cell wall biosynthesis
MATGTATVVGRYGAASEVLGDAAHLVDPLEIDDLSEGLLRVATDGSIRRDLELKGRAQAARYTWTATARATAEAYKVAMA